MSGIRIPEGIMEGCTKYEDKESDSKEPATRHMGIGKAPEPHLSRTAMGYSRE